MPWYFSIKMMFFPERVKPNFIKNVYYNIIDEGFEFAGGYRFLDRDRVKLNSTITEISEWNQAWLENRHSLGYPNDAKNNYSEDDFYNKNYRQILFKREEYSEIRGFWTDYGNYPQFDLIIPELEVMYYERKGRYSEYFYYQDAISPLV